MKEENVKGGLGDVSGMCSFKFVRRLCLWVALKVPVYALQVFFRFVSVDGDWTARSWGHLRSRHATLEGLGVLLAASAAYTCGPWLCVCLAERLDPISHRTEERACRRCCCAG